MSWEGTHPSTERTLESVSGQGNCPLTERTTESASFEGRLPSTKRTPGTVSQDGSHHGASLQSRNGRVQWTERTPESSSRVGRLQSTERIPDEAPPYRRKDARSTTLPRCGTDASFRRKSDRSASPHRCNLESFQREAYGTCENPARYSRGALRSRGASSMTPNRGTQDFPVRVRNEESRSSTECTREDSPQNRSGRPRTRNQKPSRKMTNNNSVPTCKYIHEGTSPVNEARRVRPTENTEKLGLMQESKDTECSGRTQEEEVDEYLKNLKELLRYASSFYFFKGIVDSVSEDARRDAAELHEHRMNNARGAAVPPAERGDVFDKAIDEMDGESEAAPSTSRTLTSAEKQLANISCKTKAATHKNDVPSSSLTSEECTKELGPIDERKHGCHDLKVDKALPDTEEINSAQNSQQFGNDSSRRIQIEENYDSSNGSISKDICRQMERSCVISRKLFESPISSDEQKSRVKTKQTAPEESADDSGLRSPKKRLRTEAIVSAVERCDINDHYENQAQSEKDLRKRISRDASPTEREILESSEEEIEPSEQSTESEKISAELSEESSETKKSHESPKSSGLQKSRVKIKTVQEESPEPSEKSIDSERSSAELSEESSETKESHESPKSSGLQKSRVKIKTVHEESPEPSEKSIDSERSPAELSEKSSESEESHESSKSSDLQASQVETKNVQEKSPEPSESETSPARLCEERSDSEESHESPKSSGLQVSQVKTKQTRKEKSPKLTVKHTKSKSSRGLSKEKSTEVHKFPKSSGFRRSLFKGKTLQEESPEPPESEASPAKIAKESCDSSDSDESPKSSGLQTSRYKTKQARKKKSPKHSKKPPKNKKIPKLIIKLPKDPSRKLHDSPESSGLQRSLVKTTTVKEESLKPSEKPTKSKNLVAESRKLHDSPKSSGLQRSLVKTTTAKEESLKPSEKPTKSKNLVAESRKLHDSPKSSGLQRSGVRAKTRHEDSPEPYEKSKIYQSSEESLDPRELHESSRSDTQTSLVKTKALREECEESSHDSELMSPKKRLRTESIVSTLERSETGEKYEHQMQSTRVLRERPPKKQETELSEPSAKSTKSKRARTSGVKNKTGRKKLPKKPSGPRTYKKRKRKKRKSSAAGPSDLGEHYEDRTQSEGTVKKRRQLPHSMREKEEVNDISEQQMELPESSEKSEGHPEESTEKSDSRKSCPLEGQSQDPLEGQSQDPLEGQSQDPLEGQSQDPPEGQSQDPPNPLPNQEKGEQANQEDSSDNYTSSDEEHRERIRRRKKLEKEKCKPC